MKNKLSQAVAASIVAVGLLFAAPAAAQAYTPTGPNTTTITITAGGTYDFSGFTAGADVTFTLVGENAAGASLAYAKLAVNSSSPVTKTASETGVATVSVTLPSNAPSGLPTWVRKRLVSIGASSRPPAQMTGTR